MAGCYSVREQYKLLFLARFLMRSLSLWIWEEKPSSRAAADEGARAQVRAEVSSSGKNSSWGLRTLAL